MITKKNIKFLVILRLKIGSAIITALRCYKNKKELIKKLKLR